MNILAFSLKSKGNPSALANRGDISPCLWRRDVHPESWPIRELKAWSHTIGGSVTCINISSYDCWGLELVECNNEIWVANLFPLRIDKFRAFILQPPFLPFFKLGTNFSLLLFEFLEVDFGCSGRMWEAKRRELRTLTLTCWSIQGQHLQQGR